MRAFRRVTCLLFLGCGLLLRAGAGTVVVWGANNYEQVGGAPAWTNVAAIAAGMNHCLALNATGTAVSWGWNYYGQTNVPDWWGNGRGTFPVNGYITNGVLWYCDTKAAAFPHQFYQDIERP
jgi:hypothetical protein